jgi:hypothetical protein
VITSLTPLTSELAKLEYLISPEGVKASRREMLLPFQGFLYMPAEGFSYMPAT